MAHRTRTQLGATVHDKGVDFCVWAPFAAGVSLLLTVEFSAQEIAMTRDAEGYWSVSHVDAEPGQSYTYKITSADGTVLEKNDPRARQITDSDNGASVIVAGDFDWEGADEPVTTAQNEAIIYELHIGTFNRPDASTTGTFYTAIEKLDYLQALGITYIELMPVTSMAMSYGWGYAPNHIFSVENSYGGRHGLLEFVKDCHQRGIGVILDVVYNHFFKETDLWQYDGWSENNRGGIYFYNDLRGETPWGGRPDYGRPEVRQFILDNVTMWLTEFKIDGLRIDSTIFMRHQNGDSNDPTSEIPEAYSLLSEMTSLARKINPHALLIAEDNASLDRIVQPTTDNGLGFSAQWEVGFPHVIRESMGFVEAPTQSRLAGIAYELAHTYRGDAFDKVIFSDSHDSAANGSARLNEIAAPGNAENAYARHQTLLANALTLTAPGIPMLLQGQEFMQEGSFNDWQMLEWEKTDQFNGIVSAHKHLIDLRLNRHHNTQGLMGQYTALIHRDDANGVIAYHRKDQGGPGDDTVIIVNFSDTSFQDYELFLPHEGHWRVRFNSSWKGYSIDFHEVNFTMAKADASGKATISMPEYSVLIVSIDTE